MITVSLRTISSFAKYLTYISSTLSLAGAFYLYQELPEELAVFSILFGIACFILGGSFAFLAFANMNNKMADLLERNSAVMSELTKQVKGQTRNKSG